MRNNSLSPRHQEEDTLSIVETISQNNQKSKLVKEVAHLKSVVSQMQDFVTKHHYAIKNDLIDDTRLQITVELFKKELE